MNKFVHFFILCAVPVFFTTPISEASEEPSHPEVILMDYDWNEISLESNTPYSPKNTCGECHDYDEITNAYHFQHGRTDAKGNIIIRDDMDSKNPWLISHGMYGKW
jgi:hypothetical protein